jgi:hypothetical protein
VRRLTDGKSRMESPAEGPTPGLLAHITGQGGRAFRVVDVWESEDAFEGFGETLLRILKDIGVDAQPDIYPAANTFVSA